MKIYLFALCLSLGVPFFGLSANTIMVSVQESGNTETALCLSAMESGIMDELFEAGHIVFNDLERGHGEKTGPQREILLAREGGADRLMKILLRFKSGAPCELETLSYVYIYLSDRHILKEETLTPEVIERVPEISNEEFCLLLGKEIGKRIQAKR